MKKKVGLMLIIVNCCLALNSYATMPLGEMNWNGGVGGNGINTGLVFLLQQSPYWIQEFDMSWEIVKPLDVGKTFPRSSLTSEDFSFWASRLTNGTDDNVIMAVRMGSVNGGGGATGGLESMPTLFNKFVPTQGVDFYGYEITEIDLTVNSLTVDSPGRDWNGDGLWTDFYFDVTFTIYGVPEPTTVLLLGLGGLAVMRRRRA